MDRVRIFLVDDHELFRRGVQSLLAGEPGFEVIGEASDGRTAVEAVVREMPDIVLMDLNMPGMGGLEATREILRRLPYVRILVLTVSEDEQDLFEAIKAGAQGYLLKNTDAVRLVEAIRQVHGGQPAISGPLAGKILTEMARGTTRPPHAGVDELGAREREVLQHLARGYSNKEIAAALYISENTVRNHVKNILAKLHLQNRVQAAAYAIREGIAENPAKES